MFHLKNNNCTLFLKADLKSDIGICTARKTKCLTWVHWKGTGFNGRERRSCLAKIMIVDDEEHILMLYSEELKREGYDVVTANSGYELTERVEHEQPHLVVLDIRMVDYDSLVLLQDLRNRFYDLPVILATAYDSYREDGRSIAEDYYVVKSLDLAELKTKIAWALEAAPVVHLEPPEQDIARR